MPAGQSNWPPRQGSHSSIGSRVTVAAKDKHFAELVGLAVGLGLDRLMAGCVAGVVDSCCSSRGVVGSPSLVWVPIWS